MAYNPKWNVFSRIIDGDTRIRVIDDGDSRALIEIDATQVADFKGGGLQLATGARVNEFSTDGTLGGDSDTAIPTEAAVKSYVDAQIGGSADKIWEGDSYVEVVDDGTAEGYVTFVVDGVEVGQFKADQQRLGTTDDFIAVDSTAGVVVVPSGSVEAMTVTEDGLSLAYGVAVDEFSTDGTLADDSDTAVPTEKAVKTYVDAQISSQSYRIFEGDSYVQVVDDSTNAGAGYVEVVVDGTQVQYWDDEAATIRMGKVSGAGRVTVTDSQVDVYVGTEEKLTLTSTTARLGENNDCSFTVYDSGLTQTATLELGNTDLMFASATGQFYIGPTTDRVNIDFATHVTTISANSVNVASFAQDTQRVGQSGDTYITMTQSTGALDMYSNGSQIVDFSDTSQVIGVSGDTQLNLNQSTDTFTLSAGANTQVSGGLTSLTIGVAGDTTITLDQTTDQVAITAGGESQLLIETDGVSVYEDLTVTGNLYVDGTTWVVHNQEVTTSDNMIVINNGETGPGVTSGYAGLEIDRGTLTDYRFIFDEATDTFRVGEIGALQPVATREDTPENITVPWWNNTEKRFETQGNTAITVDTTAEIVAFYASSAQVGTFESDGLTLALGTNINEFSIDGTLSGDSDDAVPTEAAVKAYVDAQIGGSSNWIFEGDSFVRVTDDTTAAGYIEIVADGVQVAYFDAEASTQRIGKVSGAGRVTVTDTTVTASVSTDDLLTLSADTQRMGLSTDTYLQTVQSTNTITGIAGTATVLSMTDTSQTLGVSGATYFSLGQSFSGTMAMRLGNVSYMSASTSGQQMLVGKTSSQMNIDYSTDTLTLVAGSVNALTLTSNVQTLGVAADTNIELNQTGDTITLEVANTIEAIFDTDGLSLKTGASVNEFSIDGTLVGNSDDAVPTEKAVKTYVDTAIANLNPDKIWEGDSYVEVVDDGTALGYVSIVADGVEVAHFDANSSTQRIGKLAESRMLVSDDTIAFYAGASPALQATLGATGLQLATGAIVDEISTDGAFTDDSDTTLITQKAAKTYVDTEITTLRSELDLINVQYVYSDTTAVSGDVLLVDTTAGDVNIELVESGDSKIVVKKITGDANNVIISTTPGTIDGKASVTIDTKYQAYHFVSDSTDFFIL